MEVEADERFGVGAIANKQALIPSMKAAQSACRINHPSPQAIWCVGRNYLDHIKELPGLLGISEKLPSEPLIFIKSASTILTNDMDGLIRPCIRLPFWTRDVHHELELAIGLGDDLEPAWAAVAIDLTARDVQARAKSQGFPWAKSKSFATSCPLGSIFPLEGIDVQDISLELSVNRQIRQSASTAQMIFDVKSIIRFLKYMDFPIRPGDLLLTGTPSGVARIQDGDSVMATGKKGDRLLSQGSWIVAESHGKDPLGWLCNND